MGCVLYTDHRRRRHSLNVIYDVLFISLRRARRKLLLILRGYLVSIIFPFFFFLYKYILLIMSAFFIFFYAAWNVLYIFFLCEQLLSVPRRVWAARGVHAHLLSLYEQINKSIFYLYMEFGFNIFCKMFFSSCSRDMNNIRCRNLFIFVLFLLCVYAASLWMKNTNLFIFVFIFITARA